MKVAIVNEGLACPPNAGNWIRTLNLMLPLAKRHEITYICRGSSDQGAVMCAREFYADHGIKAIITKDHSPRKRGLSFYAGLGANLFSELPYSIASHNSPAVRSEITRLAATGEIDVWQFETLAYSDALRGSNARTIVTAHNVESLIWQRLYETERHPLKRWYIRHQWQKFERHEGRVLREATRVVTVSPEDSALLRSRFGVEQTSIVDNGVDVAYFADRQRRGANPRQILFLGSLDWRPNIDSVDLLLNRIFPEILAAEPDARLCIVGRNPSPALVRQARATPNVELHADVPDVRPYLAQSGVMAVPLRIGGGSRLKILEAVASGVPVVATRIGCEGLAFEADRDISVVDGVEGMSAALLQSIRQPSRAQSMARSGQAVIDERYDWSRLADRLENVWYDCAGVDGKATAKQVSGYADRTPANTAVAAALA